MVLLLLAPLIDVFGVLRVDVDKGIKQVRHLVVLLELVVDGEEVLEAVPVEGPAGRGVLCGHGVGRDGPEAGAPALEDDDLEMLAGFGFAFGLVVDGDPGGGGQTVALAGEEGLVVLGEGGWGVVEERGEDGFQEGDVVGACDCEL